MMLISYWMDARGLMSGSDALRLRPLWIYSLCMILAMLGIPVMCAGLWAWAWIIRSIKADKWERILFRASAVSYTISSLYIIAIDCLPPVVYLSAEEIGISSESILLLIEKLQKPFFIPVISFFLIEDIGVSAVLWHLIFSEKLRVPKWMLICCPAVMLVLDVILKQIPMALARDVSVTLESLGWLLFMVVGITHLKRSESFDDCA